MEEQLLKEYVATYLNPKYNRNWDVVNSKFPELSGVDKQLLKEYVSTYLNPTYKGDWNVVNSKFPELFAVEQPKKKGATVSQSSAGGLVPPKSSSWTQDKEKDFSGLQVQVKDETILNKEPRAPRIGESRMVAASESTRVPNVRIPQKEQAPDKIDEKLQQVEDFDFDKKVELQKVSTPMSYLNIFSKTIADLPADLGESWSVASAFIERQLGKAGVPGANPNLTARDLHFYKMSEDYRKFTDEVYPSNKEDRSTFIGGVASGLGQVVPMFMTGGISMASKAKTAIDLAKTALTTGSKLTPFIKMGKDIAKQATSPSGLIGGSQMSSAMYRDAIESGATEDQAQRYAIENFFVGTIAESLPIQSMFSRILKIEPNASILRVLKEGGIGASEEALTEMWQTTYENLSAQRIYDLNREMLDGVGEAGAIGGTIGFILNTALAALTGRRARVKNEDEAKTLDKSIEEVQSKINTVNKNNEDIITLADELETLEPVVLKYGDADFTFIKDKSGKMEFASDPMTEEQALEVASFLGKTYKSINFLVDEIESTNPLAPTEYKIVAMEKAADKGDSSLLNLTADSYTIDGSKMDRGRFVAAVQEAKTEDALNDLETTDPEVQKIINAKRAEITGQSVVETDIVTDEVYNNFVDKNVVPDDVLNTIADKVISRTDLSEKETAIFNGKTSEINEIIKDRASDISKKENKKEGTLTRDIKSILPEETQITEQEKEVLNNLSSTENISIDEATEIFRGYRVNDYERINSLLRQGLPVTKENLIKDGVNNEELATLLEEDYNKLSRVLSNSTFSPQKPTTLYRVLFGSNEVLNDFNVGDKISDKAFVSTTINEDWVKGTKLPMIKFELDKGDQVNGFYVSGVEKEFIIDKGTDFVVKKKEVIDGNTVLTVGLPRPDVTQPKIINVSDQYTTDEVNRVKALPVDNEDGATMNLDGTKYEKGGLVIPLASRNLPLEELTPEKINEFVKENSESIGSDLVKVGIYKFPGRAEASIDINIVADKSKREEAIQIARELGQESIFDLDTFENIKTGSDGKNPKVLTPKEFLEIQERLSRKPEATVTPETSSNYANMTEDNEGNFVFFHVGDKGYETIKPGTGMAPVTSREEASALAKVGGMAMYYTGPEQGERQSAQGAKYAVKVPKNKVYDFNTDPLNLIEEAKKRHEAENPGKAFDPNSQIAYVTKIAGEKGFDMVVAEWAGGTRAQTTKELAPVDVEESTGNVIDKKFKGKYKSNKEKGFKSVVPARKADKLQKVYEKINEERNSQKRYDDLYRLYTETDKYTQQEITDLINNSDLSQEIKDEYSTALESKEDVRRSEAPGKKAKARLSSGVEQQDTRTQEEEIVREMDKLAEQSPEEAAFEEVQDAGKKDIGEAVAQNPTPNKKSFVKKALEFLGLSSENQLYRNIEEFANMPMMIGISDTLGSGVFKDALGNPMNVDGGLLFNLFRNLGLGWANVDKKYAENLVKQAKQVYASNKELYDRLWKEGALPEGHIPYAIVRMADDALYSNEAIFRYLSPWVKTLPLENRKAALEVLKKELETSAKKQAGISWIFELQDNIDNGSIENFDGLLSYVNNLKNSGLPDAITKSIVSLEKSLKNLKGDEAFSDGIEIIAEILDKKAPIVILNFIEKNNITTVDQFFDAIAEDAVKRAKGDPNNKSDLSLPIRTSISTKIFSTEPLTTGKPSSKFSKALLGATKNPLWADVDKLTLPYIKEQISEPAMLAARPGDIVAIMGIDVREGSSGVVQANHNNYGYGPKGKLIAYLKEPARAFDVFAELKAKAPRLFKPDKSGAYPSPESVVRQAGGVAYVDVPFRGARLLTEGVTKLDIIIGNLRTAFPEVGVFTTEQEFDEFLKQEGIRSRKDQNGNTIYGITKDGKVFLNPDNKSLRTPIHEFAHIWVDYLRSKASGNRGKELLNKGLQLVDGTQEYTEALEKYGEREIALEEALVELIATKGDTIINASQKSKFKNWLNALFKYIKEKFVSTKKLFDTKKTEDVEFKKFIENMTIDDFMNISLADLFGMTIVSRKFKPSEASTSAKARMSLGKLPARVESTILDKISEQEALGKKPIERAKEAIKYLKSTDAYNKLSERDKAKAIDGVKRLAGVRVKVLVDEVAALKDQIKQAEKLAEAKNELPNYQKFLSDFTANIREMVRGGKISTFKAGVIIGRIANTNPFSQSSVNKTIDYIGEVFDSANLAMKISRAKSLVKNAKRNIKSKIGQNPDLFTAAKVLLSIDPHLIPTPLIDDYLNVMEVIGERAKVLSIKDAGEMAAKMNVIINAVIKEAEAKAKADEEANVKPKREAKAKPTPEESAKAAEKIIEKIENEKLDTSKVLDKNSNAVARKIESINRKDMTNLLSKDEDGVVDYSKLNLLLGIRDNIKAGIVTNEALNLATTVEQNRGVDTFSKVLPKIDGMSILNGVTRTLGEVKSLITNKTGVLQSVRGTGTFNIDDVLGNFNDTTIYKLTFGKLASAKGKLDATISDRAAKASAAEILFQKGVRIGFNLGPIKFTSRTNNDVVKAKYKVQTLLLQKEFESNPGNESVSPAIDFINATIKAITKKESSLTKQDAKILREIKTEFGAKDADGKETLNFKKMEESLTENDKKAMKLIEEINASTAEEALFTSSVIRGNRVDILNNYVHHAVSDKGLMEQMVDLVNKLLEIGPKGKPSTKAGTLNERTPGAKAIIFDPVFSSMKGARETLTDFYMTPAIREVSGMLDKLENKVFDDLQTTEAQRDSVQAVKQAVREALEITFQNHFSEDSFGEALIKGIQKLGYQSMLASLPRAGAELVSNMSYAILSDPLTMTQSVKLADFAYSSDMLGFLENIGSSEATRLAGNEMLTSKYAESGFAAGYGRTSKSGASSKVMNYASFIGDMTVGNLFRTNDVTADLIVSTPDKSISKPYYAQLFVNKFKELTGIELSKSDLKKISEGTSEYLSPEYENAIQKSREEADLAVVRMAGSTNSFNTILKNVPRKTDKPWTAAYRAINSLMARFYLTEYGTTRSAIIALFKTGQISRQAAIGLMTGSLTRMSMYLVAFGLLSKLFDSAIANLLDLEEPEEEEEDLMTTAKRSIVGSGVNLLTRRTLGNVPYIPVALGVELLNEELGEDYGLRDGDYDPYKNSLVFSKITSEDFYTKSPYEIFGKVVAGPFSPIVSTGFRAITLGARAVKEGSKPETKKRAMDELTQRMSMEAVGNFGLIPFYKDARRIMINDFYARNYDKKEDSSFTITKKQIDLVRKSNPRAAERLESRRKSEKKKGKKESSYERTKSN